MTMANYEGSALSQWEGDTGLEDFGASDATIPRLRIDHADGAFVDSQTDIQYQELNVKMLGLVKQRLMWPSEMDDGENNAGPLCKSYDFKHGFPNMNTEVAADKRFPWSASNFSEDDLKSIEGTDLKVLSCNDCRFREWGTDPKANRPWCSEEWVIPLLYESEDGSWNPAILSLHRSALKPAKRYFTAFNSRKLPLFTAITKMGLDKQKRGMVKYCTPTFTRLGSSDKSEWDSLYEEFISIRDYLKAFPQSESTESSDGTDDPWGSKGDGGSGWPSEDSDVIDVEVEEESPKPEPKPKQKPKQKPKAEPEPEASTSQDDDDEDPPF